MTLVLHWPASLPQLHLLFAEALPHAPSGLIERTLAQPV